MTRPLAPSTTADPLPRATGRIVLRRLALVDLPAFQAYRGDEQVGLYQGWKPQSDLEASQFIVEMSQAPLFRRDGWVQLGIADRRTNTLIGDVGIHVSADVETAEIGFTLDVAAQGAGLGTEAVREAIALVFELAPVAQIVAVTDARNLPSVRLLERVGMRKIETTTAMFRGEPCTEYIYAITRHE